MTTNQTTKTLRRGTTYSAMEIDGYGTGAHIGHGGLTYQGIINGWQAFRCSGCSEQVYVSRKEQAR
jgi:hypothetical protein